MATTLELVLLYLVAAVAGVVACRMLRLPPMLGYLVVGVLIGPNALALANRLRLAVEAVPVRIDPVTAIPVTISIGLALSGQGPSLQAEPVTATLARADRALLRAKACGRNQVTTDRPAA